MLEMSSTQPNPKPASTDQPQTFTPFKHSIACLTSNEMCCFMSCLAALQPPSRVWMHQARAGGFPHSPPGVSSLSSPPILPGALRPPRGHRPRSHLCSDGFRSILLPRLLYASGAWRPAAAAAAAAETAAADAAAGLAQSS